MPFPLGSRGNSLNQWFSNWVYLGRRKRTVSLDNFKEINIQVFHTYSLYWSAWERCWQWRFSLTWLLPLDWRKAYFSVHLNHTIDWSFTNFQCTKNRRDYSVINGIIKASLKHLFKRYIFSNYYLGLCIKICNKTVPLLVNCIPVVIVLIQSRIQKCNRALR